MAAKLSISVSSSDHLEARVTHSLKRGNATEISYHFFIPTALRMRYRWRDRDRILENYSVYGRFSSPRFTLSDMINDSTEDNPLWKLVLFLDMDEVDEADFCNTLRLFGNTVRYAFGRIYADYRILEKEAILTGNSSKIIDFMDTAVQQARSVEGRWLSLKESFLASDSLTDGMRSAIEWMDEAWCRESARTILRLARNIGTYISCEEDRDTAKELASFWKDQKDRIMTARGDLSDDDLLYRQHMLKKWYQSILYLKPIMSRSRERVGQVVAGFAAGSAMAVALSATFLANSMFMAYTYPWIICSIIAYAFKDRIKEWLRLGLTKALPKVMSDSVFHFNAPTGRTRLCQNKIRVRMTDSTKVRPDILEARRWDSNPFLDVLPAEDVLVIEHDITTPRTGRSKDTGKGIMNSMVSVISKISLRDFFRDMDDQESYFFGDFIPGERFSMEEGRKSYHVRLIVQVKNGENVTTDHYLIRLTKNRIESLEKLKSKKN